tara:strand:- start:40 stop:555 length:516 start_codon:yes stop_codon:yes gene_type:complete
MYKISENFLDPKLMKEIQKVVFHMDFPWRHRKEMYDNDGMYFTHSFFNDMEQRSTYFNPLIRPILTILNGFTPIQIRANMFINDLFTRGEWHRDSYLDSKTAIFYLNTCDGGTELKINNKIKFIKAEENKMLIFDTPTLHRAVTSSDQPIRYVINFNYYEGNFDKGKRTRK